MGISHNMQKVNRLDTIQVSVWTRSCHVDGIYYTKFKSDDTHKNDRC